MNDKQVFTPALSYAESMPVKPFRYAAVGLKDRIKRAQAGQFFFNTGISTLDKYVRLRPTTYNIIAAESGAGKTALALQIAAHIETMKAAWGDPRKTLIFSAEMSSVELMQRLVAARTGISVWKQESGDLTPEQVDLIYRTADEIAADTPFQIDETDHPDRAHIIRSCEIVVETVGLACIIFDYVELASTDEKFKAEHVRSVATAMKNIARQFDIPAIGLSQVNKDRTHRGSKKPEMTDLRYGGHEPADVIVILDQLNDPGILHEDGHTPVRAWVVKNRSAPKNVAADMLLIGAETRFIPAEFGDISLNGG